MASFATPDELATLLGLTFDASDIVRAQLLLDVATGLVKRAAKQTIEHVDNDTVQLRGSWDKVLQLPERPVTAVSAVSIEDLAPLTADVDFEWDRLGRLKRTAHVARIHVPALAGYWGGDDATVHVTYSHGYETVPDDVKGLCLAAAARTWINPEGLRSKRMDDYVAEFAVTDSGEPVLITTSERDSLRSYWPRAS